MHTQSNTSKSTQYHAYRLGLDEVTTAPFVPPNWCWTTAAEPSQWHCGEPQPAPLRVSVEGWATSHGIGPPWELPKELPCQKSWWVSDACSLGASWAWVLLKHGTNWCMDRWSVLLLFSPSLTFLPPLYLPRPLPTFYSSPLSSLVMLFNQK